ncbi:MAG: molybdopterin-dependent oxidoreductase [Alphaproteobacteria bacterium]|nr:molybdopterin-dependent oxidoreductase [Alphaproteobacteria bacterium]
MPDAVRTTCPYCGVGCGVLARRRDGGLSVAGDPDHPANRGRLCVKGAALGETVGLEGRLLEPRIGGVAASWDRALDAVAEAFATTVAMHGPEAVAFYVSGQLLTEDYYVANKLMKGFIGGANIDTNSRLCMASSVAGHARAFGSDTVPGNYEDLEQADLVVLAGSNAAWCHPVLFQRIEAAKAARPDMRVVVLDPRRTATADTADLHLALRPGSDAILFNRLLAYLESGGATDQEFIARHCVGFEAAVEAARGSPEAARACALAPGDVATFFDWFARTKRTVTLYSQGINQSSSGTDKVNAIINCHLATGRIGRPGMGPFSLTGQPNAMGGREVGGLANQLAAHMGFDDDARDRVGRFWRASWVARSPGLKAVQLFEAIDAGRIKTVWIMATNPAFSLPETGLVRRALGRCDFVAVSDCMQRTDTARYAHVLLPALAWAEKDGTVTNSERCISRQRAVRPPPGDAKSDWWMICEVAKRMGFDAAFDYDGPAAIFREHARLSAFENNGRRDFDIGGLAEADYETLTPVQWPVRRPGASTARLFADRRFFHADGRARFVAVTPRTPASSVSRDWPLILNTGRARDHWHSLSRSGASPRLWQHEPEPWLSIHPEDAVDFGLRDGGFARVESPCGDAVMRVRIDLRQRRGEIFAPMHWSDQFAFRANVGRLIASHTDPVSGQPELKCAPVRLRPAAVAWEATLLARDSVASWDDDVIWSRVVGVHHVAYRLAGTRDIEDWGGWARARLSRGKSTDAEGGAADWIEFQDRRRGAYRAAILRRDRLDAVLFVGKAGERPAMDWLAGLFAKPNIDGHDRRSLLASAPLAKAPAGPIICTCHQVGRPAILEAIASEGASSVEAIGRVLGAGTNCGSCIPELRELLRTALPAARSSPLSVNHRNKLVSEEGIR